MLAYLAMTAIAIVLLAIVTVLVRRDRRARDLERRALARALARLSTNQAP